MTVAPGQARCTPTSARVGEPLAGTAPEARAWLAIEQSGPWGRDALTESHLDREFGAELALRTNGTGVKPLLIRGPGRHADDHHTPEHRAVWIAFTAPGRSWMRRVDVHSLDDVLALDLPSIGEGAEPTIGVHDDGPLLMVCTNAKRDQCCAIEGRPAAHAAAAIFPGRVWECSHLGGHRFSATALLLPYGFVHGRLDTISTSRLLSLASQGQVDLSSLRGRSCWSAPGQAAETHVRAERGFTRLDDVVDVRLKNIGPDSWMVAVELADGAVPSVRVSKVLDDAVQRPESCIKPAVSLHRYAVESSVLDR